MTAPQNDYDVIIIGAGHNGLAAGATMLFPLSKEILRELEFEKYGAESIDLPIMSVR